jgi:hypothetical protein
VRTEAGTGTEIAIVCSSHGRGNLSTAILVLMAGMPDTSREAALHGDVKFAPGTFRVCRRLTRSNSIPSCFARDLGETEASGADELDPVCLHLGRSTTDPTPAYT